MDDSACSLSLHDALSDSPPPELEPQVKKDFIASLEAESFSDEIGETVGKMEYIPLHDDDEEEEKSGSKDSKIRNISGASENKPATLENGEHGAGDRNTTEFPERRLCEEVSSKHSFMPNEVHQLDVEFNDFQHYLEPAITGAYCGIPDNYQTEVPQAHTEMNTSFSSTEQRLSPVKYEEPVVEAKTLSNLSPGPTSAAAAIEELIGQMEPPVVQLIEPVQVFPESVAQTEAKSPVPVPVPVSGTEEPKSHYELSEVKPSGSSEEPIAKPEEKPAEVSAEQDITSPPTKDLPPSPEKKAKPSTATSSAKPSVAKTRPPSTSTPRRPTSSASTLNKKTDSPTPATSSTSTAKRPASTVARPSTLTPKETKPKPTDIKSPVKSPEKRTATTRPAATPRTQSATSPTKASPSASAAPKTAVTPGSAQRTAASTTPRRPTSIKTDAKSADKKSTPAKSPSAEAGRLHGTPVGSVKSTATTPSSPGMPPTSTTPNRPRAAKPSTPKSGTTTTGGTPDSKKQVAAKVPPRTSPAPKQTRLSPAAAAAAPTPTPAIKNVKSKIGSIDNIKHQPGGGKVQTPPKASSASRTPSTGGSKQTTSGTSIQITNRKLDTSKVSSKCGSKTNIKHKPGGGEVKIETHKLEFKEKAQSKVGSLDNVKHSPGGGTVKTEGKEEEAQLDQTPLNGDLMVPQAGSEVQENGVGDSEPTGVDQRQNLSFETQIQETSI